MSTLVTSALPYANGSMHLGHVRSTYIPADIYVRFLRAKGEDVKYVCGTDEHGTPIVIRAEKEGKTPKEIGDYFYRIIDQELKDLGISFDNFSQTSRQVHHELVREFYKRIKDGGHIYEKEVKQLFCEKCNRFLPDRYVEGICKHCGKWARGDHCEGCGRHLSLEDLKDPICTSCGGKPVVKKTTHYFFKLSGFTNGLREYLKNEEISENSRNYAAQWLNELNDWDITRDMEWGVKIPGAEDKVFYVWFDAPIGYVSFTKEALNGWKDYWRGRVVHFIGKDIIYHHALFWPAVLMAEGEFPPPAVLRAGGFLTLEGEKMSTSRNHVVWIRDYLEAFPPDYLRYFLMSAAALEQDIDFSWQNFEEKINSELIGNYGNFINRVLSFCKSRFDGKVPKPGKFDKDDEKIVKSLKDSHVRVTRLLEEFNFVEALKEIMSLSRAGNEYFQKKEPWKGDAENTVYLGVNLARSLAILAEPFMPFSSKELLKQINTGGDWDSAGGLALKAGHRIGDVRPVFRKIEQAEIDTQVKKLGGGIRGTSGTSGKSGGPKKKKAASCPAKSPSKKKKMVEFADFEKLDLRVAEILDVRDHPNADKLYVLDIDLGDEKRQIVAGVKQYYKPGELKGRKIVVVANLKPVKLRGVESKGMLLAAGKDDNLGILTVDKDLENGSVVG